MGLKEGHRWWKEAGAPGGLQGEGGDCVRMGLCHRSVAPSWDPAPAGLWAWQGRGAVVHIPVLGQMCGAGVS